MESGAILKELRYEPLRFHLFIHYRGEVFDHLQLRVSSIASASTLIGFLLGVTGGLFFHLCGVLRTLCGLSKNANCLQKKVHGAKVPLCRRGNFLYRLPVMPLSLPWVYEVRGM